MKNIYVFGNEYLEFDNFANKISQYLKCNYKIFYCRSPDDLLDVEEDEILILDIVKNIKKPIIVDDIDKIKTRNILSLHDFDLGYFLKLMKEMGISKKVKIIGIPQKGNTKDIAKQVEACI